MAKKPKPPEKDSSERWLLTYSDLMNLLLILFIIFYSMSQTDKAKAEAVAESIRAGFGYVENGGTGEASGEGSGLYGADMTTPGTESSANPSSADASAGTSGNDLYWSQQTEAFKNFYDDVEKLLKDNNLDKLVDVSLDDRGVVISFKDNALFQSGQAELGTEPLSLIDNIGSMLRSLKYTYILVEGHTDTDPIHTSQFKDNMDLSTQRAANVWRELVKCGLSADNMASVGYGEYRPIAPNDTPENKAKNRRVVVTILRAEVNSSDQVIIKANGT
jgi:chemotaxis protein MotB